MQQCTIYADAARMVQHISSQLFVAINVFVPK
jgi:hypothetical protein